MIPAELQARLALLARIAAGLCRDAGVSRVVLSADDRWAWSGTSRELSVGRRTLAHEGVDVCAGIIAHEVGHSFLSRYHLAQARHRVAAFWPAWMNAIEDTRVERWMARRYPGVEAWLATASDTTLRGVLADGAVPVLRHAQWALAACADGTVGTVSLLDRLLPDVRDALDATRLARYHYRDGFLPAVERAAWSDEDAARADAWAHTRALHPVPDAGDAAERHILTLAFEALRFAEAHVLPTAEALLAQDVEELAGALAGDAALADEIRAPGDRRLPAPGEVAQQVRAGVVPTRRAYDSDRALARRWLEIVTRQRNEARRGEAGARDAGDAGIRGPGGRARVSELPTEPEPLPPLRTALVARVERAFADNLRAERTARRRNHAQTGARADLRRVLHNEGAFAQDPSRWLPAFHRPVRVRPDAAFGLLIDCSGSMAGPKARAAVDAAQIFIEALQRVGVPYWVAGFQDELIPLAATGCTLAEARAALAGVPLEARGRRPGGHNRPANNDDGPCVLQAATALRRVPAAQRVLLVLSDGSPAGRHSTAEDLHTAVRTLTRAGDIDLLGIGIGSTHVAEFYPRHLVVDPIDRLPEAVAELLAG